MDNQTILEKDPFFFEEEQKSNFSIRDFVLFFWRLKYWIIASVAVALLVAYFYGKITTPIYTRSTSAILINENEGSGELALLSDLTGNRVSKKIDNEVFILSSPSLMKKVVEELDLNTRYYQYRIPIFHSSIRFFRTLLNVKEYEFYKDSPYSFHLITDNLFPEEMLPGSITVEFKAIDSKTYKIREVKVNGKKVDLQENKVQYGSQIRFDGFTFSIEMVNSAEMRDGDIYLCTWSKPYAMAQNLAAALTVEARGSRTVKSDVMVLTIEDSKPRRAEDILNTLITKYNSDARSFKNTVSINTIAFIDTRLQAISKELGEVETDYRNYQSSNVLVNLESQSELTMTSDMQYENQLTEVRLQEKILDMVKEYLSQTPAGEYRVIPSNIGVADNGLNSIIGQYNVLVAERNRLISNSSATNPRVLNMNQQLEGGRESIDLTVNNLAKIYAIREKELLSTLKASKAKMASIPGQQFDIQQLSRRQQIIEPLYLLLQQKKEEAQISMYSQSDNVRVVEPAFGSPAPTKPQKSKVMLLAFIIGFIIPPCVIWIRKLSRSKVETKKDVEDAINAPVVATIPKNEKNGNQLIVSGGRDTTSEAFRMLRSNMQFLSGKVIQVTSSIPGEGKSYISANIALSLAHIDKKVLIIGLDLRKPVLKKYFPKIEDDKTRSVVGYLVGKTQDISALPVNSGEFETLDVILSGAVPPNPSELLSTDKLANLINYFRDKYDYIICDTAPFFSVSDSLIVNRLVDYTLYVVRSDYSMLKMLPEIEEANKDKRIKGLNLVINGMDFTANKYKYGYGYGYGSKGYGYGYGGYGYGYGYGYGHEHEHKHKNGHNKD